MHELLFCFFNLLLFDILVAVTDVFKPYVMESTGYEARPCNFSVTFLWLFGLDRLQRPLL